jgi:hypothetical protein
VSTYGTGLLDSGQRDTRSVHVPPVHRKLRPQRPDPRQEPVQPLAGALASSQARFAGSAITVLSPAETRGIRKLSAKAQAVFGQFPDVTVGDWGIKHEEGGLPFVKLTLGGTSYFVGCGEAPGTPLVPGTPLEVVTGLCLGGADSIIGWAGKYAYPMTVGPVVPNIKLERPIDRITVDGRVHVYEAEMLARLMPFIRGVARLRGQGPVRVRAHLPAAEYELYGLSLYAKGLLPAEWCDLYRSAARHRAHLISRMLKWCLRGTAEVTVTSPLNNLVRCLDISGVPREGLARFVHAAVRKQSCLWQDLLAGKDTSFRTLIYSSYTYHYLAVARQAAKLGRQVLFAEPPDEEKIYRYALKESDRIGIPLAEVPGFYIHPRVVVTEAAFGMGRVLRDCKHGCEPRTVAQALACYGPQSAPWAPS